MSDSDTVRLDTKGLDALLKAFEDMPTVRVGVLGSKDHRESDGPSNAEIGAAHEFGTTKLPIRSFLRMPLSEKLSEFLENSGAFDKEALQQVIQTKSIRVWMGKIGLVAELAIQAAFSSGGFGKWKPSDMTYKHNKQTLVETTQLRNSITSEVV